MPKKSDFATAPRFVVSYEYWFFSRSNRVPHSLSKNMSGEGKGRVDDIVGDDGMKLWGSDDEELYADDEEEGEGR